MSITPPKARYELVEIAELVTVEVLVNHYDWRQIGGVGA